MANLERVTKDGDLEKCFNLMRGSAEHYSNFEFSRFKYDLQRKKGEAYYFESGQDKIALIFLYNTTNDIWKIGAYTNSSNEDLLSKTWDKVKEFLAEKGTNKAYATTAPVKDYSEHEQFCLNYLIDKIGGYDYIHKQEKIWKWDVNI